LTNKKKIIVIDACALEKTFFSKKFWKALKQEHVIMVIGRELMIKEYFRRITAWKKEKDKYDRIRHAVIDLLRSAEYLSDSNFNKYRFEFTGEPPKSDDLQLFIAAKEGAIKYGAKECIIISTARDVLRVKDCKNSHNIKILIKKEIN